MKIKINRIFIIIFVLFPFFHVFSDKNYSAIEYYNIGKESEIAGDFYNAIEMYKSALLLNENYLNAIIGLAHAYYGLYEFDESLRYIQLTEIYDVENTDILILKARNFLNKGELEKAKKLFESVLEVEENNIEAVFGLAELDIASGRTYAAEDRYENVLLFSPESRKALLSLVIINDSKKSFKVADTYIQQALKSYPENPFVRYIAARHYYYLDNIEESKYHIKTALMIKPDLLEASIFSAKIYMEQGEYQEATLELEQAIKKNSSNYILWYMLGRANEKMDKYEKAFDLYHGALVKKPDEEIARIAIENLLTNEFEMDNPERRVYSEYHIDLGEKYEGMNLPNKAYKEYRRAIKIDPYSIEARYRYAIINKFLGYKERYVSLLEQLQAAGKNDVEITDEIEIQKNLMETTLSEKWGIDQFQVDKDASKLSVFISNSDMSHIEGEEILLEYLVYLLLRFENIEIIDRKIENNFAACFRNARGNNSDYFIIINCKEKERITSLTANIYNSSTGNVLETLTSVKTGNQKFVNACQGLIDEVHSLLPVYGKILNRRFNDVIVNLGEKDGIKNGDELNIIKKGSLKLSKNDFELEYQEDEILGTYTVNSVNELVSEGSVKPLSFFDMINQGDIVFLKIENETPEENTDEIPEEKDAQLFNQNDLFNSIINIR